MPLGGVDVFACNAAVRSSILELEEANSSLVGQLLWIGYRRTTVGYERLPRSEGKSAWTFAKKLRYLSDSIFSFTDLPIRFLLFVGILGSLCRERRRRRGGGDVVAERDRTSPATRRSCSRSCSSGSC